MHLEIQVRSLCQAQPAKRLAEPDAARLIFQILQGVDHMHSHGFVHRDLKVRWDRPVWELRQ